ncbi:MAG: hypothetical protein ACI31P_01215, partial [Ligilactobacillus ruminis]
SVNGSDFAKCSACSISQPSSHSIYRQTIFGYFRYKASCIQKTGSDLQLIPNHPGFRFEADFFPASSFNLKHSFSRHILLIFIRA